MFSQRSLFSILIFIVCAAGAYFASDYGYKEKQYNSAQMQVAEMKQNWIRNRPTDYEYELWEGCMLSSVVRVRVENGVMSYREVEGVHKVKHLSSIESLFDQLITAHKVARKVEVSWSKLGYPDGAKIDWSAAIDDECSFQIQEFRILDGA